MFTSRIRLWAGRAVAAVAIPAAALAALEGAARLAPASRPTDSERALLWVAGRRPAFPCAPDGACRTAPGLASLSVPDVRFRKRPAPGVFRAACVGDSTTAGWPYHPRGGYPQWLQAIMSAALPGRRVEVLDLGVHAWDGARLEDVFAEALALRPDAVLLRVGYDDYANYLLRRPRGGALARALLRARLFLLRRSAAFRLLARAFDPGPRRGLVGTAPVPLTPAETDRLVAEHRARLRRLAARAKEAGVALIVLGLPYRADEAPGYAGLTALARLRAATADEARALGLPYVSLDELQGSRRFVDLMHSDETGYRLTAVDAARALQADGLPRGARWRWDRVPPPKTLARALGLDDPAFRAHVDAELAGYDLQRGLPERAAERMRAALREAPNPDFVPDELREIDDPAAVALYRRVFAALRATGEVPDPTIPDDRDLAGLPSPR
ncbi:MAG: SGNH/GDSL hydrolase family protein [Elusimicrobia bacterium]|nr:SGNH/GDSL hydrolase family protein [Elusimicrobiota bacterium]